MIVFGPLGSNWRRKWQPTQLFLSWRIPWTEEPGALESQRVGHNWSDLACREVIRIKWDSTGKALIWWNRNPYKRMRRHQRAHFLSLSPLLTLNMYRLRKGYLRTQKEHSHLQTRKRALTRNQPCWHFDLAFVSRIVRKLISVKSPPFWVFSYCSPRWIMHMLLAKY